MATKLELELKINELENDLKKMTDTLAKIWAASMSVDFDQNAPLEVQPSYLLGVIRATAKFAPANCVTVRCEEWLDLLEKSLEKSPA